MMSIGQIVILVESDRKLAKYINNGFSSILPVFVNKFGYNFGLVLW